MNTYPSNSRKRLTGLFLLTCSLSLASTTSYAQENDEEEELFELSPFEVTAQDSSGYRATASLAGTRIKTDLKDIASSISVVTKDFLRDTNATDNQSLLTYTTNTEVGGVGGNFAGVGNTYIDGVSESANFVAPNNNTRVRGLDSADNTRDYFLSDIPWDSFNVERVELQRGPNSILFGIGSPAGIINTSVNRAFFGNESKIEAGFGSFGSNRLTLDMNRTLIEDQLAIRVALLNENQKYRQAPAFEDDKRIFASLRWKPDFAQSDSMSTSIRASVESGEITANRPRVLPPQDRITPFFDSNAIDRQTWDPYYAWVAGVIGYQGNAPLDARGKNYWTVQYPGPGIQSTSNPIFTFDNADAANPSSWMQASPSTNWGVDASGNLDAGIGGFPYGSNIGIGSYNEYALNANQGGSPDFPAADKGFYKSKSLTDTSIFNFYDNLIDGNNKKEWQNWDAYNLSLEQTFKDNMFGYEIVLDRQKYDDGQTRNLNGAYISVDIRENLMQYPWAFDQAVANPNAGRAFVGSSTRGNNSSRFTDRSNDRITAYADIDFVNITGDNTLSHILGRHIFNGVYSESTYEVESRDWIRYAVGNNWSDAYGNVNGGLVNGDVVLDWMTYLSGDLRNLSSASGLNLSRITEIQNISGTFDIPYFDSTWNSTVDPGALWNNPTTINGNSQASTQSENPFNYVGWTSKPYTILNADEGDIDQLYTGVAKNETKTRSKGIVWQGKLFDGVLVPTWGYREDTQTLREGNSTAAFEDDGIAHVNPAYSDKEFTVSDNSTSWGAVLHTPKKLADMLPWGSSISLSYNEGRNIRVQNRFGFGGEQLPNASGFTKDYGFVISTLNDRLSFKTTFYETTVANANISSVSSETATLGNNTYYLRNLEAWGTASALTNIMGRDVAANPSAYSDADKAIQGWNWYWNWALIDGNSVAGAENFPGAWDNASYDDVTGANFTTHPSTIKQTAANQAWLAQMNDQTWFDAYGFPVDVAKVKAGDWAGAIKGWTGTSGVGGVQPAGGGRINGVWPTGTVDYVSKGVEYELIGNLTNNWSISVNASKTDAYQTALGAELSAYIEAAHDKYESAAGDLRLWWGGDNTVRQYFNNNIWSAYQFQLQTNGKLAAELSPWSFNLVTNYNFNDGKLAGMNIGGGYRWKDGKILGYGLNDAKDNLDINRPFWSETEDHFDLWAGKDIKLNDNITWRVQLNLRNVGEETTLKPLSVQPNGDPGVYSIQEGMTWNLTNTFSF